MGEMVTDELEIIKRAEVIKNGRNERPTRVQASRRDVTFRFRDEFTVGRLAGHVKCVDYD